MTIAAILREKGSAVVSVSPDATVSDLIDQLARHRIGAAVVREMSGELLGIVSERDVMRALAEHGPAALALRVEAIMTRGVQCATRATSDEDALETMTHGRFRHLPVVENGALIGLVSIGDVVKARLSQQAHEVDSLKAYVAGAV